MGVVMEWSDVRIFLAIVRSGTFGGAARSLQISHPTVGRRLRALEQAIGHALFQRTADGLVLTDEGQDRKSTRLNSSTNAHLVCRLLLEKKKTQTPTTHDNITHIIHQNK